MIANKVDPKSRIKSAEFLAGYIYNELERAFFKQNKDKKGEDISLNFDTTLPNVWITGDYSDSMTGEDSCKLTVIKSIIEYHISNGLPLHDHAVEVSWSSVDSHHKGFKVKITPVPRKKLTIKEIEEILGYKIKIVE